MSDRSFTSREAPHNNRMKLTKPAMARQRGLCSLSWVFARREPGMRPRKITPTTILNDAEVREVVAGVQAYFGEWFGGLGRSPDVESTVRLSALSKQCGARREQLGFSLREAALLLRVPQYRLKGIEGGHVREIDGKILRAYVSHLGMGAWYKRWKAANPELADKLEGNGAGEQRDAADGRRSRRRAHSRARRHRLAARS